MVSFKAMTSPTKIAVQIGCGKNQSKKRSGGREE
jgi:hypothetical protein